MTFLTNWIAKRRLTSDLQDLALLSQGFYVRGMYTEAAQASLRASELIAETLGAENLDYGLARQAVADLYAAAGDHATAATYYREALDVFRRSVPFSDERIGHALGRLTTSYWESANFQEATSLQEEFQQWMIETKGKHDPATLRARWGTALLQFYLGRNDAAFAAFNELVDETRALTGPASVDSVLAIHSLGLAYAEVENFSKARQLLAQASEIAEQGQGTSVPPRVYALIQSSLGLLYDSMDDHASAEKVYLGALSILGEVTPETRQQMAVLLNNLAGTYRATHREQASEAGFLRALELVDAPEVIRDQDYRTTKAMLQTNLSQLYRAMGRFEEAENLSRQSMTLTAEARGKRSADYARALHTLARILADRGKTEEAEQLIRESLAISESVEGRLGTTYGASLTILAALLIQTNRYAEAAEILKEEVQADDRRMWAVLGASSERQRLVHLDRLRLNTFGYLSFVLLQGAATPQVVRDLFDVVLRRKAASLEILATERLSELSIHNEQFRLDLDALQAVYAQLCAAELGPSRTGDTGAIETWRRQREELEARLSQRIPELALDVRLRNVTSGAVRDALPPGSALIEYVRFEPFDYVGTRWRSSKYLAFVLPSDSEEISLVDLGDASPIDDQFVRWRDQIMGKSSAKRDVPPEPMLDDGLKMPITQDLRAEIAQLGRDLGDVQPDVQLALEEGTALRKAIFDPLASVLRGHLRLFVAPDGPLSGLSFESLPSQDGRFLIDHYTISYVTVGRDILRFGADHSATSTAPVVAADPAFDLGQARDHRSTGPFPRLSGARAEGRNVAALLGVEPLMDDMVLEGTLKKIQSPAILHLATHGFFFATTARDPNSFSEAPPVMLTGTDDKLTHLKHATSPLLRSGLALAGANTWVRGDPLPESAEDGLLMAADVFQMHLLGTELVTLSACETGLGEVHVGESIFGLRRAFVVAGAKTLVMSLWKVPDAATQELMSELYGQLVRQTPRAEALRAAQLVLKSKFPTQPFYWGAFICQGDPYPLEWTRGSSANEAPVSRSSL